MSRIVFACWGSYGDLFPYLAIADRLKALGHTPVVASCALYKDIVTGQGVEFRPLRPTVDANDSSMLQRIMDPRRGSALLLHEFIAAPIRDSYEDITAAADGADLVVSHPITVAARMVAETKKIPWVSSVLAPSTLASVYDFPIVPVWFAAALGRPAPWVARLLKAIARRIIRRALAPVAKFRADLGLPPAGDLLYEGQFSPHGTVALFSRQFGDAQRDWPPRTRVTGFPFFNRAILMPDELAAFLDAGEPPVVFTLGSAAVGVAGTFYEESAAAIAQLKCRAVLLVGRHPQNIPRQLPPNVIAVDSAPHDQLFPRASVVVHQGGAGTTGQAMRSGRPELVVPFAHDQPDNAFRVRNLGIARVLYPKCYVAARVVTELRLLMNERRYAERSDIVGRQVRAETGAASAAAAIVDAI